MSETKAKLIPIHSVLDISSEYRNATVMEKAIDNLQDIRICSGQIDTYLNMARVNKLSKEDCSIYRDM